MSDTALIWGRGGGGEAAQLQPQPMAHTHSAQSQQQGPQPCTKNRITASLLKFWGKKIFYRVFLLSVFIYCSHFLALPCALVSILCHWCSLPAIICVEIYKSQERSSTACRMSLPFHEKELFHKFCLLNHQRHLLVTFRDHNMFRKQSHGAELKSFRNTNK